MVKARGVLDSLASQRAPAGLAASPTLRRFLVLWLNIGLCVVLIPAGLALALAMISLAIDAASWVESKVGGHQPGKLRKTLLVSALVVEIGVPLVGRLPRRAA